MEPMKPMKPMEPMKPLDFGPPWWPEELGQPNSSGSQNSVRYAFFSETHRLAIERDISGVSQQQSRGQSLTFSSQDGMVNIGELKKIQ